MSANAKTELPVAKNFKRSAIEFLTIAKKTEIEIWFQLGQNYGTPLVQRLCEEVAFSEKYSANS